MTIIFLLNFAYSKDKYGTTKALSPNLCDAAAVLLASGAMRRWTSALKIFRSEGRRIDFIFRVYYPVYLVRCEGDIIPVDGLGMSRKYFYENKISEEGLTSTLNLLPALGPDLCPWLRNWNENSYSSDSVHNGFAIPPAVSKEEVQKIAYRIRKILLSNRDIVERLEREIALLNDQYNKSKLELEGEYRSILEEFDNKISLKNLEIEDLETYKEVTVVKQIKSNFTRRREELNQQRGLLERKSAELKSKINELEKEEEKILSCKDRIEKKIEKLRRIIDRIQSELEATEISNDPSRFNEITRSKEKHSREVWKLDKELEKCVERFNEISAVKGELKSEIGRIDEEMKILLDKESFLPSKEEEEISNIRTSYLGRRENLVRQLLNLTEEKDRRLMEIRSREVDKRLRFEKERQYLEFLLSKTKSDYSGLESIMLTYEEELKEEVDLLQIPFYFFSTEDNFNVIEPQLFFGEKGKIDRIGGTTLVRNGLKYIEGNWEVLSTVLFKARGTFDLLSSENRGRIIAAAEDLKVMGIINDFQLSYIKTVSSK